MKKFVKPVLFLTLAAFIATSAMAAEGGNPRKGKHLFKKTCKTCHSADGAGGEVTPMTKTQARRKMLPQAPRRFSSSTTKTD